MTSIPDFFDPSLDLFPPTQGSFDDRSSRPPVKEDDIDRDRRRGSAEKQKSAKDLEKKKEKKKNLERQVLETRRAKSRQRVEPEEDSPDEGDDNEGDDGSDDSEGMVARLDKILEDPPQADVDIPWMGAPKRAPDGHQREPSPSRSRADTPPLPAPGRAISRPQPPPAPGAGHRVKTMATGPLTRGRTAASSQGDVGHGGSGPNARRSGDVEPKPAPAHKRPGVSTRGGSRQAGRGAKILTSRLLFSDVFVHYCVTAFLTLFPFPQTEAAVGAGPALDGQEAEGGGSSQRLG